MAETALHSPRSVKKKEEEEEEEVLQVLEKRFTCSLWKTVEEDFMLEQVNEPEGGSDLMESPSWRRLLA